jgi:hypothetical protein
MEVTLRPWNVAVVVLAVAMASTFMLGRYVLPAHGGTKGYRVDIPAFGPIYLTDQAKADSLKFAISGASAAQYNSTAQANVRAAVPGMEAYYADHDAGYTGVTLSKLHASYDAGIKDISIVRAGSDGYCIESTVGSASYHKEGPAGDIAAGPCQ